MNRRKAISLIPLSITFAGSLTRAGNAQERRKYLLPPEGNIPRQPPFENLPLAIRYTKKVRGMLQWIRDTQSENLLEASYAIARTVKNGGKC